MRTIDWVDGKICIIDQTRLPAEEAMLSLETVEEVAEAISSLRVRGAPALGVAGGLGIALAARRALYSEYTSATWGQTWGKENPDV